MNAGLHRLLCMAALLCLGTMPAYAKRIALVIVNGVEKTN